jgi:hypothetical protein
MRNLLLRSLPAAAVLYVAYFGIGVLLDVVTYATIGLRPNYAATVIWAALIDAAQILAAISTMKLFFNHYEPRYVLAIFTTSLAATLATIFIYTPELAGITKTPGIGQAAVAIGIAAFMLLKGRL